MFIVLSCTQFYFTVHVFSLDAYDNTSMVCSPLAVLRSLAIFTVLLMIRIWRVHKYCGTFYKYDVCLELRYELIYRACGYTRQSIDCYNWVPTKSVTAWKKMIHIYRKRCYEWIATFIWTPCTTYVYKCLILNFEKYILQRNLSVHTMYTLLMSYLIDEITIQNNLQNKPKK